MWASRVGMGRGRVGLSVGRGEPAPVKVLFRGGPVGPAGRVSEPAHRRPGPPAGSGPRGLLGAGRIAPDAEDPGEGARRRSGRSEDPSIALRPACPVARGRATERHPGGVRPARRPAACRSARYARQLAPGGRKVSQARAMPWSRSTRGSQPYRRARPMSTTTAGISPGRAGPWTTGISR